jgi:hypothetical protein
VGQEESSSFLKKRTKKLLSIFCGLAQLIVALGLRRAVLVI